MPEISRFFGIIIRMYWNEHNPPHFHAVYGSEDAEIGIDPIRVIEGSLPRRATSMVLEWAALHQMELAANWELLENRQAPQRIEPLE